MSGKNRLVSRAIFLALAFGIAGFCFANPNLPIDVWTDISPSWLKGTKYQTCLVAFDPTNRSTLYLSGSFMTPPGLIKSTDGGSTWARVGTAPAVTNWGDTVSFLDAPFQIEVDPANSQHMYCTEISPGGGNTLGFWVTTNGGATWVRTKGFMDAVAEAHGSTDVGHMAVDPTDFNHVLITSHYYWNGDGVSGIFETKDGGNTFIVHNPVAGMSAPSKAVIFLYDPALGIGDKDTWLLVEDNTGMWRTTNAGATWTKVFGTSNGYTPHGGTSSIYYTPQKVLYIPTFGYLQRSTDNGATWQQVPGSPYANFYSLAGDGTNIYTGASGVNAAGATWYSASVLTGTPWTSYTGGLLPTDGVTTLKYDAENHILYSANASAGLWAMKIAGTSATAAFGNAISGTVSKRNRAIIMPASRAQSSAVFDIRGRSIDKKQIKRQAILVSRGL